MTYPTLLYIFDQLQINELKGTPHNEQLATKTIHAANICHLGQPLQPRQTHFIHNIRPWPLDDINNWKKTIAPYLTDHYLVCEWRAYRQIREQEKYYNPDVQYEDIVLLHFYSTLHAIDTKTNQILHEKRMRKAFQYNTWIPKMPLTGITKMELPHYYRFISKNQYLHQAKTEILRRTITLWDEFTTHIWCKQALASLLDDKGKTLAEPGYLLLSEADKHTIKAILFTKECMSPLKQITSETNEEATPATVQQTTNEEAICKTDEAIVDENATATSTTR